MCCFSYDTDDFWQCAVRYYTGPENHQASSCRMGPASDPLACVNNKLEVYGISGLRIMDASVMPYLVSGNTHATIVLIAERGVAFIKQKWLPTNTIANRFGSGAAETKPKDKPFTIVQSKPYRPDQHYQFQQPPPYHNFNHNENWHRQHPNIPDPFAVNQNINYQNINIRQNARSYPNINPDYNY